MAVARAAWRGNWPSAGGLDGAVTLIVSPVKISTVTPESALPETSLATPDMVPVSVVPPPPPPPLCSVKISTIPSLSVIVRVVDVTE